MPDLSATAVAKQWTTDDPRMMHVLMAMEKAEKWTLDGDLTVEASISGFGKKIESSLGIAYAGKVSNELMFVMAHLKASRALRLLKWLDSRAPGVGLRIVQQSRRVLDDQYEDGGCDPARVMIERLDLLKRVRFISKVFSTSRIRFVLKALESENEED